VPDGIRDFYKQILTNPLSYNDLDNDSDEDEDRVCVDVDNEGFLVFYNEECFDEDLIID